MPETTTLDLEEMVIVPGPLAKAYGQLDPSTINTGTQISADRVKNEKLRNKSLYTANVGLVTKRDGKLYLGIGGRAAFNAVFGYDTKNACEELIKTGYVHLNPHQRDAIFELERQGEIIFVDPKDLQLQGKEVEYRSFPIRTARYDKDVTVARQPFVHAGFGSGLMLGRVMDNIRTNGNISETRVYTINPEHAADNVRDDEIVARASGLVRFGGYSGFFAVVRGVDYADGGLLGVRMKSAEGAAPKIDTATA